MMIDEKALRVIAQEPHRLGWDWYCRGSKKIRDEWVYTEPENGAEWTCIWNAEKKEWEPSTLPPWIEPQTETANEDEEG
jgi:hypothetical protein